MGSANPSLPVDCLKYVQAPMVGISDLPFRLLVAHWGCTLTYTQMLVAPHLLTSLEFQQQTLLDLEFGRAIRHNLGSNGGSSRDPLVVAQLAGNQTEELMQAGKVVMSLVDGIGCPQQRALEGHYGGYLVNKTDLPLVTELVSNLSTLPIPLLTKTRIPPSPLTPAAYALHLAQAGSSTITLHARPVGSSTKRRDLKHLRTGAVGEVKRTLVEAGFGGVGVVGNGGVRTWNDVGELTRREGVDGWMVGEELSADFRFFTPNKPPCNPLELTTQYLDIVDLYSTAVPLFSVKRHVKDFTRTNLQA
ncbi:tRNA-dihydrouridine synthase [Phaffia rhodozyma]|uniref:tRNA-dihydrouridine synthase n=1 Tax=Phaffia rhodozyma TaxID=264483 RepID=A0A0F7SQJ7_PHARH|nr:tRNA-dihydrouridine synthase [Phaffia rhodozyma]